MSARKDLMDTEAMLVRAANKLTVKVAHELGQKPSIRP